MLNHTAIGACQLERVYSTQHGNFGSFGWSGILRGAGVVFFAYIGFDAVSTAAQEAQNPQKDMPIGILGSLVVCTILYPGGLRIVDWHGALPRLNIGAPVSLAMREMGVAVGKLCGERRSAWRA